MLLGRRIMAREKERMRDITERVTSLVPNLEEDEIFARGQSTWDTARARVQEAENSDNFKRIEIVYGDAFDGVCTEQIYAIGYGPIISGGRGRPAIFFLSKYVTKPDKRGDYVEAVEFDRLTSFRVFD